MSGFIQSGLGTLHCLSSINYDNGNLFLEPVKLINFFFFFLVSACWFFLSLFIYLFLAALGLHCYVGFSLVAVSGGYSLVAVFRLLITVAFLAVGMGSRPRGLSSRGSWALEHRLNSCGARGLAAPRQRGSSQTRDRTCVSYTGRWVLYH